MDSFCTVVHCMDGRAQQILLSEACKQFDAQYADSITEAGLVRFFRPGMESERPVTLEQRLRISLELHASRGILLAAHSNCGGNPVSREQQEADLKAGMAWLRQQAPDVPLLAVYLELPDTIEVVAQDLP